jgi:hypothetical protein
LTNNIVVLHGNTPAPSDVNARKIAEFLGAEVTNVSFAEARNFESIRQLVPTCAGLIIHADTLVAMADVLETGVNGLLDLLELGPHVFVYGFGSSDRHASILKILSSGGLQGLESLPITAAEFHISDGHARWCAQFSGLPIRAVDPQIDSCFVDGGPPVVQDVLVRAAGQPFFVRVDHGESDVFLVACSELGNLDEKIPQGAGLLPWFSRLIPLMIFLRRALGDRIWHSNHSQACFIIDDPLLTPEYGFLKYSRLLQTTREQKFSACIAFIPWNYQRSRKRIADMFSNAPHRLSLCIHGCDHTRAEFGATSFELLRDKARLALDRMQVHMELSGIPFDKVMVFPQGLYSSEAIRALDACGYLAAVNTELSPLSTPQALILRDLLDVAVTKFAGFPLFSRHYPRDTAEFAFDLFLGKPALVVEHHGYFRNGYEGLGTFLKQMNELDQRLEWHNLATICSQACLRRVVPNGDIHVRFYTNRFRLTNGGTRPERYVLSRRWTGEGPLPNVTLNGRQWMVQQKGDSLAIALSLDAGQTADIRIISERPVHAENSPWKPTKAYKARVFARRILCEFRDNYVETNGFLSGLVSNARKLRALKRRDEAGDSGYANRRPMLSLPGSRVDD